LQKGKFADDVLLAHSRDAAYAANSGSGEFSVSFVVVGNTVSDEEKRLLAVGDDLIEWVEQFPYLGSLISDDRRVRRKNSKHLKSIFKPFLRIASYLLRLSNLCTWHVSCQPCYMVASVPM